MSKVEKKVVKREFCILKGTRTALILIPSHDVELPSIPSFPKAIRLVM